MPLSVPFPTVLRLNALLFASLALGLLLAPGGFAKAFGLDPSTGAEVMARRAGAIFLGLAPLYLTIARTHGIHMRHGIARASLTMMLALLVLGLLEWAAGRVGPGILAPVTIELVFAALYLPHALRQPG